MEYAHTHGTSSKQRLKSIRSILSKLLEEAFYLDERPIPVPEMSAIEDSQDHDQFLKQYLKPFT